LDEGDVALKSTPTTLGRYEVLDPLAVGGMATVHLGRARDARGVREPVALKLIKNELLEDPRYVEMFRDEASLLVRLAHPNIVTTLEADVTDGQRWIAMELLLGRTAADLCDECTDRGIHFPHALAAALSARVAHALDYAHKLTDEDGAPLAIIHRDANPSNMIITYDGRVKLIDFGLARSRRRRTTSSAGIVKGKLPYLSPEQVKLRDVDHRSDVYTLGAALWEMTTGRRLWKRETDVETVLAIQDGKVPDPTELVPGYPDELWAIVWEALMPQPDHRYADAAAMAKDLESFLRSTDQNDDAHVAASAAAFIEELFPGERARREAWARKACER
jgi:serine/threonine-protein kinase